MKQQLPAESAAFRRSRILSDTGMQGRLVVRVAACWAIYHVVLWHAMFLHRYILYRGELAAGARPMPFSQLYSEFVNAHTSMLMCALFVLPVLLWETLKQTHRIAGPVERIRGAIRRLSAGCVVEPLRVRAGDLLGDLVVDLNEFLAVQKAREIQRARETGSARFAVPPEPPAQAVPRSAADSAGNRQAPQTGESPSPEQDSVIVSDPEASAIMQEIHDLQRSAARPLTDRERQELELYRRQLQ